MKEDTVRSLEAFEIQVKLVETCTEFGGKEYFFMREFSWSKKFSERIESYPGPSPSNDVFIIMRINSL